MSDTDRISHRSVRDRQVNRWWSPAVPHVALAALLSVIFLSGGLAVLEYPVTDLTFRMLQRDAASDVTLVALDPASLETLDVWPWPRGYHATVLENLLEAGAVRIAFDIDFSSRSEPDEDREFASVLESAGNTVILPSFRQHERGDADPPLVRITAPIQEFRRHAAVASIDVQPATDGLVRRYRLGHATPAESLPSLAASLASLTSDEPAFHIDFAVRPASIPRVSYRDVLTGIFDKELVRDRVVIVGATAVELGDRIPVPVNAAIPGPVLQAIAYDNIRTGRMLRHSGSFFTVIGLLILSIALGPALSMLGWRQGLLTTGMATATLLFAAVAAQYHLGLILDISPWFMMILGSYGVSLVSRIDSQNFRILLQGATIRRTENLMHNVVESSFDAILTVSPDGTVETFNRAARELFGYRSCSLEGRSLHELLVDDADDDAASGIFGTFDNDREATGLREDGSSFPAEYSVSEIAREENASRVVFVRDITDRKQHQDTLHYLAMHDPLTGLPNRLLLQERTEAALEDAEKRLDSVGFMILDLDRFKEINDTLGHHVGDRLLARIARRLRESLRPSDTIARLGGDEFAVLMPGTALEGTLEAARRLCETLEDPFSIEGLSLRVGGSIGVAMYPDHGRETFELLQKADVAMYIAKNGHAGIAVYQAEDDYNSLRHLVLNGELQEAIEQDHLVLHYQPKICLQSGSVTSAEALVRWKHPEHGMLPPDEFIGLAEHSGLIRPLTRWVLDHAIGQCVEWHDAGYPITVAVNISARNLLEDDLPTTVDELLRRHGLPPRYLVIEITEGLIMEDPERAREIITQLASMGTCIAIDDFGTGYSSLAYLKRLPTAEIKIDKSFVMEMDRDREDALIVRSTIELAHSLDRPVVAEGIEKECVRRELVALGCDYGQGYLFSPPLPPEQFAAWLRESRWSPLASYVCATPQAVSPSSLPTGSGTGPR